MMLVDICQWRAAIGCFRASTQRSVRFHCALTLVSMVLRVFRLYKFACSFIFISTIILPFTIALQFFVGIFKKNLFAQIRPPANSVYGIHDPKGVAYLTQLRVGLSKLNCHKFRHNFRDTMNPMCPINDGIEDTEHFLLLCNSFKEHRCNLLTDVNVVLQNSGHSVWSNSFLQLLLYGDESLSYEVNRSIVEVNS